MTNFGIKISLYVTHFLSFLHKLEKISFFHETVCEYIECGDKYVNISFLIFYFKKKIKVKGAYAPWIKSAFPPAQAFTQTEISSLLLQRFKFSSTLFAKSEK
jgi:hypothetical protein